MKNSPVVRLGIIFLSLVFGFTLQIGIASADTNLIPNPSFETLGTGGLPASWTKDYWGTPAPTFKYPDTGHTGNGATITFSKNSTGDSHWYYAPVSVTAGQSYTYSNWYKSDIATEIDAEYTNTSGKITYAFVATLPSSGGVWKQFTTTIKIPTGTTKAVVYQLIEKKGTLTVDDFSLTLVGATPPPVQPTMTLTASPGTVQQGSSSTLSWTSASTTSCSATGGWTSSTAISGSQVLSPNATTTYAMSCTGTGGSVSSQVIVGVILPVVPPPLPPKLTLTANPTKVQQGSSSTLTWASTNTTSCSATGGWSASTAVSGTQAVSPVATTTYAMSCTGAGGATTTAVTVGVILPVVVTPPPPPVKGPFTQGMVTLSFDDSWVSQYTAVLPVLQTAGLKGTFFLTTQPIIEGWSDFMTPAQIQGIALKGHEIADHTVTHPHMTTLSQTDIVKEITDSKTYLETLTGAKVTNFAYPYGEFNVAIQNALKTAGYVTARGVEEDALNTATTDKYDLKSSCVLQSYTFAQIKAQIDLAIANKQWYIMCIHEVKTGGDEYSLTPTQFQQIVDYIKSSGVKVVTVKEGVALMN